jgi:hypothetical protein
MYATALSLPESTETCQGCRFPPEAEREDLSRSLRTTSSSTGVSKNARTDRRELTASVTFIGLLKVGHGF